MTEFVFDYQVPVHSDWVDYNGHMNDAAYAKVFSNAVDEFIDAIGLEAEARKIYSYTIFTLETHLCYLKEAHENEMLKISMQLLDSDVKRLHVFFTMENKTGEKIATSEQMLMGMETANAKPAPFPEPVAEVVNKLQQQHKELDWPKEAGRTIGIKR
ncbi:thioesterase family protein [Planococcus sp. SIMBA_143]